MLQKTPPIFHLRSYCSILLLLFLGSVSASAQFSQPNEPPRLFDIQSVSLQSPDTLTSPHLQGDFLYDVVVHDVFSGTIPWSLTAEIAPEKDVTFQQAHTTRLANGNLSWRGQSGSSRMFVSIAKGRIWASIQHGGAGPSFYELIQDPVFGPKLVVLNTATDTSDPTWFAEQPPRPSQEPQTPMHYLDLLAVYSNQIPQEGGIDIEAEIGHDIDYANDALDLMGLNYRIRWVHTAEVSVSLEDFRSVVEDVRTDANILALRETSGADVVAVYVPESISPVFCGFAILTALDSEGNEVSANRPNEPFTDEAFVALIPNCGRSDQTLLHEISHTFGMPHSSEDAERDYGNDTFPLQPLLGGVLFSDGSASIMECPRSSGGNRRDGVCNRVPRFSDGTVPDIQGISANNLDLAMRRAPIVAGYRPTAIDGFLPSIAKTFPTDGSEAHRDHVFLGASILDIDDTEHSVTWYSDVDGQLFSGPVLGETIIQVPGLSLGQHRLRITATDDEGNLDQVTYSVEVVDSVMEPRRGLWKDALRSQTYLALHQDNASRWGLGWATYDLSGDPLPYLTPFADRAGGQIDVRLDQTMDPNGSRQAVGNVELRWLNEEAAALVWNFDSGGSGISLFEYRQGDEDATSGHYYDPLDPGWGISLFASPGQGNDQSLYFAYDGNRPVWLLGHEFNPENQVRYAYDLWTGGTCPTCSPQVAPLDPRDVGSILFNSSTGSFLRQFVPFTLLTQTWQRTERALVKLTK